MAGGVAQGPLRRRRDWCQNVGSSQAKASCTDIHSQPTAAQCTTAIPNTVAKGPRKMEYMKPFSLTALSSTDKTNTGKLKLETGQLTTMRPRERHSGGMLSVSSCLLQLV